MTPLVTLTGDGTFRAPSASEDARHELPEDPHLAALMRLRALLGDDLEEQIATRLYLPSALGIDETDHTLPATLALLAETTGDLVSYGWRLGPGIGRAWQHARELRTRTLDAARIALLGYEGPLMTTALGPATLSAATFLNSGERTLGDRGAVRDLPMLLAEGLIDHLEELRERVPGARPHLLLREDAVAGVHEGRIPTPSGRRHYPATPAPEIGMLWRSLSAALMDHGLDADAITLGVGADVRLLRAARDAGIRRMAIGPRRMPTLETAEGRALWEGIAEAHDDGCRFELVVDPRPGGKLAPELETMLSIWNRLGHSDADAAGCTLLAHTGAAHAVHAGKVDPSAQPDRSTLLDEGALEALLRVAPTWAERVAS
ncbi:hypothetical protein [Brachybacterium sacelli]|uniref:Methionine synthase n=1 Tax=Brachybacterium sacelli TaxID=173364 RepID=A0ABS4X603_9MICO|nr:hypothetical protein [Brachybacterium sacelli]MBP2383887.1 hypothetical protein [Brachybacterium sacelli]